MKALLDWQGISRQGLTHSMAHYAWQNAYCERVQRTIKEYYLPYYTTDTYPSLCKGVRRAVQAYNQSKPHRGLPARLSPDQFITKYTQGAILIIVSTFGRQ
ncbi:MAG: transposase [Balneolaceae bacterium]|nr:transposase [Balneolaceae bacterium]